VSDGAPQSATSGRQIPRDGIWIQAHSANNLFDALLASASSNSSQRQDLISLCRHWRAHPQMLLQKLVHEDPSVALRRLDALIGDLEHLVVVWPGIPAARTFGNRDSGAETWVADPLDRLGPSGDGKGGFNA